ncbi:hypothetical protein ZWY2020_046071 [Hordeum vulgare]|nr:hypothetical protein ZWY2020_046071 [Hordeum vulgare]
MEFSPRAAELTTLVESRMTNFYTNFQVDEIGRVIQAGEMVEFASRVKAIALNLENENVGIVVFGSDIAIREGDLVKRPDLLWMFLGKAMLGRVVDALGVPIDGKGLKRSRTKTSIDTILNQKQMNSRGTNESETLYCVYVTLDKTKQAVAYRQMSLLLRRPPGREAFLAAKRSDQIGAVAQPLPVIETQVGDDRLYPHQCDSITDGQIYRISQYEKAILSTINPELQKSFLEKGGLTNERKMEPDASLKESI